MKKRFFTKSIIVLTIIALLLPCIPVIASAEDIDYTATYTPDSSWYGDGTATEFVISTPEQLAYFMELGSQATPVTFQNKTIKLGADIVWNDGVATKDGFTPSTEQGNKIYKWMPYTQNQTGWNNFRGIFDGQGYTISGLYIDSTSTSGAVGFLGTTRGATIKNLNLVNAYVCVNDGVNNSANTDLGICVGRTYGAITMTNVHVDGHLVLKAAAMFAQAGILIGGSRHQNACVFTLTNCTAKGSVVAEYNAQYIGGLIGGVWAKEGSLKTNMLTMTDCVNYATVSGYTMVGGLVGGLASGATFTRCANFGAVINTQNAAGSGLLVAIRLYNPGRTALTVPTAFGDCAMVYFTDCFYAPVAGSSHDFPVFVYTAGCGHRIATRYTDYNGGTSNFKDYTVFPTHANVTDAGSAYALAGKIRDDIFKATYNEEDGSNAMLQVPAKGTDAVKVEGVQTKKTESTYAARFIASINLDGVDKDSVKAMGFQVVQYKDLGVDGTAAIREKACASAYTSIKSNYGLEIITADAFDADYIGTLVINGIPAEGIQTLLVRAYYTTDSGANYYSSYVAFSFINGEYAGSAVVSTTTSDSYVESTANLAVDSTTTSYDLAALLPDNAENIVISNDTTTFDGTSVPLSLGLGTFYAKYTEAGNPRVCVITVARREQHRVIFNSNGGSYIPVLYVNDGTTLNWKDYQPTRAGCTFTGWYTLEGQKVALESTPIHEDTTWVAGWKTADSATPPVLDSNGQPEQLIYTTSSAALNLNWKDTANAFGDRPSVVYCTLTDVDNGISYQVKLTETTAEFVGDKPAGATVAQGAGNWTVKITGLAADSNYTFTQNDLGNAPYTSTQSGTTVTNTYTKNYDAAKDDTAALYTANGRLYDIAGNVVTLKGVVTVNVGTVNFAGNTSKASLSRLKAEGVNCVRITMQLSGTNNIGYVLATDETAQTPERKAELMALLQTAIDNASELGMYCIVDWGVLGVNPQDDQASAEEFFGALAAANKDNPFVLYEVCNEPVVTAGTWHSTVKVYAEEIIEVIRAAGSQGIVIVGANDYAKKVSDQTVVENGKTDDPVDYPILAHNVAYGYHAYAWNHEYTNTTSYKNGFGWRVTEALEAGLTLIVTEFSPATSSIDAQSNGVMDASIYEANKYLNVFLENDVSVFLFRYISHFDSYETSSQHMFVKGCNADLNAGTWTYSQLTECGKWFIDNALNNKGFIRVADYTPSTPR